MALAEPCVHRLTSAEYARMVDSGALEGLPVELVDGLLVDVTPQGTEHAAMLRALTRWLAARGDLLNIHMPLAAAAGWVPEPDVALAPDPGPAAHPTTAIVVVEIIVTARAEAERKLPGYARAGVPLVWLVDVPGRAVEELREPAGDGYRQRHTLRGDAVLDPAVEGIAPLTVGALLASAGM
jgi:Uma2 family endonuclease